VNIIANYDPDTLPFLDAPVGSAYERHPKSGRFRSVAFPDAVEDE
jgi:hypothetical protein